MKKIFSFIIIISVCSNAYGWDIKKGSSGRCIVQNHDDDKKETFYYCGDQDKGCAGYTDNKKDTSYWLKHGQHATGDYYCCDDKMKEINQQIKNSYYYGLSAVDSSGNLVTYNKGSSDNILNSVKVQQIQLPDGKGTCTYTVEFNGCGDDISVKCTKPSGCTAGYVFRNGKCVVPCKQGQVWESDNSDTCVDKPDDNTAGYNKETQTLIECDSDELFSKKQNKCIKKSEITQYSKAEMQKCWRCDPGDDFKKCLNYNKNKTGSMPESCNK